MLQGELARKLKISVPYLSQLERGRRAIPDDFEEKVARVLEFSNEQKNELHRAAALSRQSFEIAADDIHEDDRELAHDLTMSFARLSPEGKDELRRIIKGERL